MTYGGAGAIVLFPIILFSLFLIIVWVKKGRGTSEWKTKILGGYIFSTFAPIFIAALAGWPEEAQSTFIEYGILLSIVLGGFGGFILPKVSNYLLKRNDGAV